ncbi:nicotinate phosphoribosyltransferase [Rhodococcus sp. WAY2]|uniref:nicotinate phosphoribosyltransferase n=1 Tax=Rhodococcus sp. WAY2 TaxID=2663121 RepID=UPI00131FC130|nr:nicotinate phosphoribosyltransferase [Rhodococcus sp. WAY2]QHE72887.1 Nicotinamide phosphoribosyltransferase [Rhodococcus sp. WAY2]
MTTRTGFTNLLTNTDNYKHTQFFQYPPGTEYVSSYIESRGGAFPATLFFGLQAFLREYLSKPFTVEDIDEAEAIIRGTNVEFNRQIWLDLLEDHGGYLPIEIEAVPEGTVVPTRNVMLQVINTDPKYFWVPSFFETALLRAVWYPTSVASLSWMLKKIIWNALERTSDNPDLAGHYLADFGARGVSSLESAALGGMAHLVNFDQSETVPATVAAKKYYDAATPAFSGVHMEHASISSWGPDGEAEQMRRMLDRKSPIVSLLTDTFNHENTVRNIVGVKLKEQVEEYPGLVGIRIDSGDVVQVTSDTVEWLMEAFGYEVNSKGFRVLPPYIRALQGDGLTIESLRQVYDELERRGLSAENALCGMGGGLLQQINRDTFNFGQKANAICIDGKWKDIAKRPTGNLMKHSKAGRLALCKVDGDFKTVPRGQVSPEENLLVPVFRDGRILRTLAWGEVLENSNREVPAYYYDEVLSKDRSTLEIG